MPRKPSHTPESLTDRALLQFWSHGFHATSMDDLVRATSVSRHGIYADFGGKRALFLACFDRYRDLVVSPAFCVVEQDGADLTAVERFFEVQIRRAEAAGLPGPGCFVANSATEIAPGDADVRAKVIEHNARLQRGFESALRNSALAALPEPGLKDLARTMVIFANGLWSMSRVSPDADDLRRSVKRFLKAVKEHLA